MGTSDRLWTASLASAMERPKYEPTNSAETRPRVAASAIASTVDVACG